jgi:PAS domain S-box-containing protein
MPAQTHNTGPDSRTPTEAHLQTLIEKVPVCLTRVAQDGTLLAVNDAALVLLGGDGLAHVLGKNLSTFVGSDQNACRRFIERIAGGERGSVEIELTNLTGNVSTLQISGTPMPGAPDGVKSALLAFRDVTEQRRLEQSLLSAAGTAGDAANDARGEGLATAVARIEDLEQALHQSEARRLELEAVLGERDGLLIDLDAETSSPKRRRTGK